MASPSVEKKKNEMYIQVLPFWELEDCKKYQFLSHLIGTLIRTTYVVCQGKLILKATTSEWLHYHRKTLGYENVMKS
jgi:hypothetical protein